jgi:hypothetical protein
MNELETNEVPILVQMVRTHVHVRVGQTSYY